MTDSHDSSASIDDWTAGRPGIAYQCCASCNANWYHKREFCPSCGSENVQSEQASGHGIVEAVTLVHRAPNKELASSTPYPVVLVRAAEGFMIMGHAESLDIKIGDPVVAHFHRFWNNECIPIFNTV